MTDPNFLRVILRNLVQNAIKFTPDGGRVSLVAEAGPAGRTTLRVADSGPGFSPAQLAQLLTPDGATPANAPVPTDPTHGLGLRLTREFVAKLGGELRATSVPGVGSEVAVAL